MKLSQIQRIFFFVALLAFRVIRLEGQDCTGGDFAIATLMINTNEEVRSRVKVLFPRLTHTKKKIEFRVDNRIEYIPIYSAFKNTEVELVGLLDSLTNRLPFTSKSSYDALSRFESYVIDEIVELSPSPSANLVLRFSNCGTGYILAEILDGRLNFGQTRYGKVLHILFVLDEQDFVSKIFHSSFTYN